MIDVHIVRILPLQIDIGQYPIRSAEATTQWKRIEIEAGEKIHHVLKVLPFWQICMHPKPLQEAEHLAE